LADFSKSSPKPLGAVSEEEFFLEMNQSETRIACGSHVCYRIGMK
jgi:hypothetical protein